MRTGIQARVGRVGAMVLVIAGCGGKGGTEPVEIEPLSVTLATAVAAVTFVTTGEADVYPACGAIVEINCANGIPGTPTRLSLASTGLTIQETAPGIYSFSSPVSVETVQPIPIVLPVAGACGVSVDTSPGSSPTLQVTGTALFTTHGGGDEINRVEVTAEVTGLADVDVSMTGGLGCNFTSVGTGFVVDILRSAIGGRGGLCGAPGPTLLVACPPEG